MNLRVLSSKSGHNHLPLLHDHTPNQNRMFILTCYYLDLIQCYIIDTWPLASSFLLIELDQRSPRRGTRSNNLHSNYSWSYVIISFIPKRTNIKLVLDLVATPGIRSKQDLYLTWCLYTRQLIKERHLYIPYHDPHRRHSSCSLNSQSHESRKPHMTLLATWVLSS